MAIVTPLRLLAESPLKEDFEYIVEEKNSSSPSTMYIQGPYMAAESINKNKRIYSLDEMTREVDRYSVEMIKTGRAVGELNHPASAEINYERSCHMVTEMRREGNVFYGKSKVLSGGLGPLVRSLINDGVKVGVSTRALGELTTENAGINRVTKMRLIAVDCVADPSFTKAFVNGILESAQYMISQNGLIQECYEIFEEGIGALPKKDVENYLKNQIVEFLKNLNSKF